MGQNEENEYEEEHTLEPEADLEELIQVLHQLAFFFENFEDPHKSGQLDKFVQTAKPGHTNKLVEVGSV